MPVAVSLSQVVAQARGKGPDFAVGITFFAALVDPQGECTLQVTIVQVPHAQCGIGPPLVALELRECAGQITVELVLGVVGTGFELLLIDTDGQTDAPGFVEAVTATQGQVVTMAIGAGRTALAIDIQLLSAGGNDGLPLADALPVALPLVAQFVLMRTQAGVGHFRQ
ncbi:hypothetical protein D3C72_1765220 [compost metagenome]